MGRVRLLRQPLPVLLRAAATPGRDLHGLPIGYALTGAKADERQVLLELLHDDPALAATRPGQALIADKNYCGREFEASLAVAGIELLRRVREGEPERPCRGFSKLPDRRGDLRFPQGSARPRTPRQSTLTGVLVRVRQRLLALTAAIWHNDHAGQVTAPLPLLTSLRIDHLVAVAVAV